MGNRIDKECRIGECVIGGCSGRVRIGNPCRVVIGDYWLNSQNDTPADALSGSTYRLQQ